MSFILDALKKSESDRLKQDAPGFSHVPEKTADRTASPWIWIIVVLIVINVAVLAVMFMRPESSPPTSAAPIRETVGTQAAVATPAPARPNTQDPETRNALPTDPRPATVASNPGQSIPVAPPRATPAVTAPAATNEPAETYATFNDLHAQGVLGIADLHLDIHVFSEQRAERFVFVNMSKYTENETLDEGPVVSQITPDGVILVHRGMTFLLPRE